MKCERSQRDWICRLDLKRFSELRHALVNPVKMEIDHRQLDVSIRLLGPQADRLLKFLDRVEGEAGRTQPASPLQMQARGIGAVRETGSQNAFRSGSLAQFHQQVGQLSPAVREVRREHNAALEAPAGIGIIT